LIYSHKPQRSGRSIPANTNNPPQDPPPPPQPIVDVPKVPIELDVIPKVSYEIPDIPIDDTTPPVPEICIKEKLVITTPKIIPKQQPQKKIVVPKQLQKKFIPKQQPQKPTPKLSLFQKIFQKIKRFFRLG